MAAEFNTDPAAAAAFVLHASSCFGVTCRRAKVEVTGDAHDHASVTLDLAGMMPGQMSMQLVDVTIPKTGELQLGIDANIDGYFCTHGVRFFIEPSRVSIDSWTSSRGDDLFQDGLLDAASFAHDDPSFGDVGSMWMPFDAGALGGYTKDNPTGMGPMRIGFQSVGKFNADNTMDKDIVWGPHRIVFIVVGAIVDPIGCRFSAHGPLYTPDLTAMVDETAKE